MKNLAHGGELLVYHSISKVRDKHLQVGCAIIVGYMRFDKS